MGAERLQDIEERAAEQRRADLTGTEPDFSEENLALYRVPVFKNDDNRRDTNGAEPQSVTTDPDADGGVTAVWEPPADPVAVFEPSVRLPEADQYAHIDKELALENPELSADELADVGTEVVNDDAGEPELAEEVIEPVVLEDSATVVDEPTVAGTDSDE